MTHFVWNRAFYDVLPFCDMQGGPGSEVPARCFIQSGDYSFSELGIDLEKADHICALNVDIVHPKVTGLPIGLDYHTIANAGGWGEPKMTPEEQEATLLEIIAMARLRKRRPRIWADFQHNDTAYGGFSRGLQWGGDRAGIFERILRTGMVDHDHRISRSILWFRRTGYSFTVSPHGNGLDCHRTWEDLVLGCIPIVKTSPIDYLYDGLPVAIVKDWDEITRDKLFYWLEIFGEPLTNPAYRERLTNEYWIKKMRA